MSIAEEITRLSNAKAAIKQSIENKGVEVSDSALLDEYPALIDSIEVGSGGEGGADPYYETLWNCITNNNTDYGYLFYNYNGKTLDLSNLDTSNVTSMSYMFYECKSLTSLDLSNFNTSKVTSMGNMFSNCSSLISLDMSNCDASRCTSNSSMNTIIGASSNNGCPNLTDFKAPKNISGNITVSYSPLLTHDSLMSIINNLATVTLNRTLTLGETNKAKLTADELAIATNKGWKIA